MADDEEGRHRAPVPDGPPAPPPRPALQGQPAPVADAAPPDRPGSAGAAVALAIGSCVAGLLGIVLTLVNLGTLRERLAATARDADPDASADLIEQAVTATLALVLGAVGLLALLTASWALVLRRRRAWARWALLVTALLTLPAVVLAQGVVAGGADLDRILFLVQGALALVVVVLVLVPATGRWLRAAAPRTPGSAPGA